MMLSFELAQRMTAFAAATRQTIREPIGAGKDGTVFATSRRTAVKFHGEPSVYRREPDAYQRLSARRVQSINGMSVPRLIWTSDTALAIEMTIVRPPFVLDFASAILEEEWRDDPQLMEQLRERVDTLFDDYAPDVHFLLERLATLHGVHLLDASPANIRFS